MADSTSSPQSMLFVEKTGKPTATRRRSAKRTNNLDGATWLSYSISVWSDIRKSAEELALKHPAMFPSMLVERLILALTNRRQKTVLDPFMGSGSTLVAAQRLGKTGIGVELNPKYVALANSRLAQGALGSECEKPGHAIYTADANDLLDFVSPNSVDITITSPPYWDILNQRRTADNKEIRHYGNLQHDLGTVSDYSQFLDSLLAVFEQVYLVTKPDSYCIVIVMDLRKKDRFYPFHSDLAQMMQRAGYILDDIIIWNRQAEYNNLRPLGYPSVFRVNKVHEFCLIFKTSKSKEKFARDAEIIEGRKLSRS